MAGADPEKYDFLPVREPHEVAKDLILDALIPYVYGRPQHGLTVRTDDMANGYNTIVPSVSVFDRKRLDSQKQKCLVGAPDLAIEVVSPTDLEVDLRRKIAIYISDGCKSVWVAYPEARSVLVYRPGSIQEFKDDQAITDPVLPEFSRPVSDFFELT